MTAGATGRYIIDPVVLQGFVAYKTNNKQRAVKKIEPAVTELTFRPDPVPIAGAGPGAAPGSIDYYIDLNQVNSIVNRRFYRQGLINAVASIKITTQSNVPGVDVPVATSPRGEVVVSKLPSTWVMANAWMKSFSAWERMNKMALAEAESVRPRFLDFKIFADAGHHAAGSGANLMPKSSGLGFGTNIVANPGEWEYSKVVIPRTDSTTGIPSDRELIAVGANYPGAGFSGLNAVSLIEGYAASRGLPEIQDPNTPDDALDTSGVAPQNWMSALFNQGLEQTESVIEDMIEENNVAPYPFENGPIVGGGTYGDTQYPGGANQMETLAIHDFEKITGSTIGGTTYLRGGAFPCGLLKISMENYSEEYEIQPVIQINLMPGHHRGLLCSPMQEM